jgi:hypothetical protein
MANPSPTPQPQTSAAPGSGSVATQQYQQQAQDLLGGGTSSTDLYSLGQWKNQPIDVSGFPPAFLAALARAGVQLDTSQKITGSQLAQLLSTIHDPTVVSNIQEMLLYAGAYGSSVKSMADLNVGIFGPKDITALGNTISVAGQTGTPFGTYLTTSANAGKANGILSQITGASLNPVAQATRADTDAVLRAQAHTLFGHDPSPDEYARFQAFWNQKLLTEANDKAAAQNPTTPSNLPDSYMFGQAIGDLPSSQSQFGGMMPTPPPNLQGGQQALLAREGQGDLTQAPFQARQQQDNAALSAVNSAGSSLDATGGATYMAAGNISSAADEFLRQDNPGAVGQQNVATKYSTLLSILSGTGQ